MLARLLMRRRLVCLWPLAVLLLVSPASADEADDVPKELPRLILDTGRRETPPAEADAYRFTLHGEHQIRYQADSSFTLAPTATAIDARGARLRGDSIGQNQFVSHWLRFTPRLQIKDEVEIVAQIDLVTGLLGGEKAHGTSADETPRDDTNGFSNVRPRWLYVQYGLPFGIVRVGQQPNHWGMGILANDGDHPSLFGDYRYGSISERFLFATKPAGKDSDFYLALAGDLVFRDQTAILTHGAHAFQGVLAAFWEHGANKIGVFSTLRHQENDRQSGSETFSYTDSLDAVAVDVHGKFAAPVPGQDAFVFGETEGAFILGSTNLIRTQDQALQGSKTSIRSYGGAAVLGVVHRAYATGFGKNDPRTARETSARYLGVASDKGVPYGDLLAQVEIGYASGDADPYDGTQKRFVFDPNHKVGLILFDEVMRWQTARSSTAAQDPLLANASRPTPGADLIPSNGGIFGAQYVNPTFIYRPRHWMDLKAGAVVAQATSEITDPYRVATSGSYVNYRGGDPKKKDLGLELDAGIETRFPLQYDLMANLGAQGGVLFPGHALDNADGVGMSTQWIAIGRVGLEF